MTSSSEYAENGLNATSSFIRRVNYLKAGIGIYKHLGGELSEHSRPGKPTCRMSGATSFARMSLTQKSFVEIVR